MNLLKRRSFLLAALRGCFLLAASALFVRAANEPATADLEFTIAGDMRYFTENPGPEAPVLWVGKSAHPQPGMRYFDGLCEALKRVGPGAFLLSPGDFDPPAANRAMIDRYLGPKFPWYTVVGNHEVENAAVMSWVRQWMASDIPNVVRRGMPGTNFTIYSWDVGNSHFVAIDSYPWAKPGNPGYQGRVDMSDAMFKWIDEDLAATKKPFIWVTGHQPLESLPDMDSGRVRHEGESVSYDAERAQQFVSLLQKYHVRAYLCGHTHNASIAKLKSGIWQVDSGHARGAGDPGSPSTFAKVRTSGDQAWVDLYRANPQGEDYKVRTTVKLD
jgi:hypothetical protein